jgi:diacylglycerol kinase family enzyme
VAEVNGRVFLCNSVIGLPVTLGRHRERHRGASGLLDRLRWAAASLRSIWRYRPLRLDITIDGDGRVRRLVTRAVAVANNAYAEGIGQMFARQRLDRGELVLYLARRFGVWWAVRMLLAMALGAWRDSPDLDARAAAGLTIRSRRRRLRVMNDGEGLLLAPPLRYAIRPLALRVILPAASVAADAPASPVPGGAGRRGPGGAEAPGPGRSAPP